MDETKIIDFFDKAAFTWDDEMIKDNLVIDEIFNNAKIIRGNTILDVACGTGVIIPDYIKREVKKVTAIDISPKMIEIAKHKFSDAGNIHFICGDVNNYNFDNKFDRIMIYNAFPHFKNPEETIKVLSELLSSDGILSIAHGMSKKQIDRIHESGASDVSIKLMETSELAEIMSKYLTVTVKISDDRMYQVCGQKSK